MRVRGRLLPRRRLQLRLLPFLRFALLLQLQLLL
jgi:hypothetical protein